MTQQILQNKEEILAEHKDDQFYTVEALTQEAQDAVLKILEADDGVVLFMKPGRTLFSNIKGLSKESLRQILEINDHEPNVIGISQRPIQQEFKPE